MTAWGSSGGLCPLLEEKQFVILNKLQSETVYTDRRGLQFMLGQIVSNAINSSDSPMLTISMIHSRPQMSFQLRITASV